MVVDLTPLAVVDFPLRGEWRALNTPAERVPSHGTDYFGQRYAYDFARLDADGFRFRSGSVLRHLLVGVPASQFFCWEQPVYSAFAGRVVAAGDGWPDRQRINGVWELVRATLFAPAVIGRDYRPLAGNFVLIEGTPGVALYAHLREGGVHVHVGQELASGEVIGAVGNSGNSTMPHLHFHLMDGADPLKAGGLPCAFRGYERYVDGSWVAVDGGVPRRFERLRAASRGVVADSQP
jgi:hypothetical protein